MTLNVRAEINRLLAVGEIRRSPGRRPRRDTVCSTSHIDAAIVAVRRRLLRLSPCAARNDATNDERRRRNRIDSPSPRIGPLVHGRELHDLDRLLPAVDAIAVPRSRRCSGISGHPGWIAGRPAHAPFEARARQMRRAAGTQRPRLPPGRLELLELRAGRLGSRDVRRHRPDVPRPVARHRGGRRA